MSIEKQLAWLTGWEYVSTRHYSCFIEIIKESVTKMINPSSFPAYKKYGWEKTGKIIRSDC